MKREVRLKKLNNEITRNGCIYRLIERTATKAIYYQDNFGFEVFKIRVVKPHPKAKKDCAEFEKVEKFPSDQDFGRGAWYYKTLEEAKKKYAMI